MAKCQLCKTKEAIWAWQPDGPGEDEYTFTALGHHYRGFPVVKVCEPCKCAKLNEHATAQIAGGQATCPF